MKKLLFILVLLNFEAGEIRSQSFTVDDLVKISSLPAKNLDRYMAKNNLVPWRSVMDSFTTSKSYIEQIKSDNKSNNKKTSLEIYSLNGSRFFSFSTYSLNDYLDGQNHLIKTGFFYDDKKNIAKDSAILYQKSNIRIQACKQVIDSIIQYTFLMEEKKIPDPLSIKYADDLLRFTSHEYLVSFFGNKNVTKDLYFFSEKELKKCSVVFMGSGRQAMFLWGDENNLDNLSYILVSDIIPTEKAKKLSGIINSNQWQCESGIHPGMSINELLNVNGQDFKIYGNTSDLAFLIKPGSMGKIDFKKTAVLVSCNNCNNNRLFSKQEVTASEIVSKNLPMFVHDIVIYPSY